MEGIVLWYNPIKAYGFIEGNDGLDVFLHRSNIEGNEELYPDDIVLFDVEEVEKGLTAKNVKLLRRA